MFIKILATPIIVFSIIIITTSMSFLKRVIEDIKDYGMDYEVMILGLIGFFGFSLGIALIIITLIVALN